MTTLTKTVNATPEQVWEILADGWLYPLWVVGASRMRDVDDSWPEVGAELHHSVGTWPLLIDDTTEVTECRPLRGLKLRARAWPTGEAAVEIELVPEGDGTTIRMSEDPVSGPATLTPKPIRGMGLRWRNTETLKRLAFLCERRP
jgi:uncharacterized protein YndB with AHSA1/START domain